MDNTPFRLDTLVELQDQYTDVYSLSPTGARGWVRARREYPKSDPEVWIEWDKGHWRYHGEQDGWTYEHHFRPVTDEVPRRPGADMPDMQEILAEAHRRVERDRCSHCGDFHDGQDDFLDTLMEAQDAALGSEGYFIMTLTPQHRGDIALYEPVIYSRTLTDTAKKLLAVQLVSIASQLFQTHLLDQMTDIEGQPDDPGW